MYALQVATEAQAFAELECSLTVDTVQAADYCHLWQLKPSLSKTNASVFHLHNVNVNWQFLCTSAIQASSFLPRDAMQTRSLLSRSVCPSRS